MFLRFLYALNVDINICPPHRPDLNSHVERYYKSFGRECVDVQRPGDLAAVREILPGYVQHYNNERPNQAVTCGNRPPRIAFPDLPALASVPLTVNPDAWLTACEGRSYTRTVNANGSIQVGDRSYYVDKKRAGQWVAVVVAAAPFVQTTLFVFEPFLCEAFDVSSDLADLGIAEAGGAVAVHIAFAVADNARDLALIEARTAYSRADTGVAAGMTGRAHLRLTE